MSDMLPVKVSLWKMIMADDSSVGDKNNNIPDVQTIYSYPV